ncbi:MAG: patatin [Clostridiaceae bacterium]|nr:patatin [Clostridiaceae bacterium]
MVLGGGGIKGIAYSGVFEVAEERGYKWGNIAGVSAGSVAGACIAAGYKAWEILDIIEQFDFSKINLDRIPMRVPVVQEIMEIRDRWKLGYENIFKFLFTRDGLAGNSATNPADSLSLDGNSANNQVNKLAGNSFNNLQGDYRVNLLKGIVKYCQKGCLFDGDYLEEWIGWLLARKGVRTFGDLRGGIVDEENPGGYKVRMTAADCNRVKVIVLPDDISYYGIDPDELEVAKAVRMSTCVPFAFKPVEIKRKQGDKTVIHYIVDGGVLDRFPSWLVKHSSGYPPAVGFTLDGGEKKTTLNMDTALDVLKALITAVHDIGVPKDAAYDMKYVGRIDTGKVSFLDFDITREEKIYLYESGSKAAIKLFNELEKDYIT